MAARLFVGNIADLTSFLAGQVSGASNLELFINPLLLQRLAQLLVLRDGNDNRNNLVAVADHVVRVIGGQLAHDAHASDVVRQSSITTTHLTPMRSGQTPRSSKRH